MTTCKCHPSSPFLWRTNTGALDTGKLQRNANLSGISTSTVNAKRKQGIEPMALGPMSNKKLAHILDPKAAHLHPTVRGRK
jgi:hypothetical protein